MSARRCFRGKHDCTEYRQVLDAVGVSARGAPVERGAVRLVAGKTLELGLARQDEPPPNDADAERQKRDRPHRKRQHGQNWNDIFLSPSMLGAPKEEEVRYKRKWEEPPVWSGAHVECINSTSSKTNAQQNQLPRRLLVFREEISVPSPRQLGVADHFDNEGRLEGNGPRYVVEVG